MAGDPPDRGVGQGLSRGPGGGRPPPPRHEVGLGSDFSPHLKSLSLDVIFSSKLEMWYEALAMLPASIPPAGSVDAGPRGRGSSSRWRRRPLPGSQRDADWGRRFDTTSSPRPDGDGGEWLPGGGVGGTRESDGDGLTTALLAGQRAHGRRDGWLGLAGKPDTCVRAVSLPLPPHSLPRARGQSPPPSLGGRGRPTQGAAGRRGRSSPGLPRALCAGAVYGDDPIGWVRCLSFRGPPFGRNDNASRAFSRETLKRRLKDGR